MFHLSGYSLNDYTVLLKQLFYLEFTLNPNRLLSDVNNPLNEHVRVRQQPRLIRGYEDCQQQTGDERFFCPKIILEINSYVLELVTNKYITKQYSRERYRTLSDSSR